MSTIPRTYNMTSKDGLSSIPLINGQVISIWDGDSDIGEVWYDAPANGQRDGAPVRRKISGVKVISTLPSEPTEGVLYVYLGDQGPIPESDTPLYDLRIWINEEWVVVGNNMEDSLVKSAVSDGMFYITGATDLTDDVISSLKKNSNVYIKAGEIWQPIGDIHGNALTATSAQSAGSAATANKATNDNLNQPILGYLRGVSSNDTTGTGSTLTFTKGDGTSATVTTVDTKYNVYTSSAAGLVNGTNTTVLSDTSGLILSGDGWISIGSMTIPTAQSAIGDGQNPSQNIAQTYIKGLSYDIDYDTLTITKGNGATSTISIPNTEYSDFNGSTHGLVPAATGSGESNMFLKGNGSWESVIQPSDEYEGADASNPGVAGLVPPAAAGEQDYYLKGDATWGSSFAAGSSGLVPAPAQDQSDAGKFLMGDGTWDTPTDTQNTAGSEADTTHKLYLIGAQSQSNAGEGVATYSNVNAYIQSNKLFSNNLEVVNVSDSQNLTNKTYNGYTLGTACEKAYASSVTATNDLPTNNAVISYVATAVPSIIGTSLEGKVDNPVIAPIYDATSTYAVDDFCMYDDSEGFKLYRCTTAITTAEAFNDQHWTETTVVDAIKYLISQI